jgi:hypothetical protein
LVPGTILLYNEEIVFTLSRGFLDQKWIRHTLYIEPAASREKNKLMKKKQDHVLLHPYPGGSNQDLPNGSLLVPL